MRAFIAVKTDDGVTRSVGELSEAELGEGDVLIDVAYSSVNYKDALATIPKGGVARISPLVPGVDLAGTNAETGEAVLVHGFGLGVAHHGGFAERARVPGDWVVPLPAGLTAREAMAIGTAGYTAARSIVALEDFGLTKDAGPVLVTGASGGVGSVAVDLLAQRGYEVVASSGKDPEFLKALGAAEVISREEAVGDPDRPLGKTRWAAAVDCVGGDTLAGVVRSLKYGGAVAASGNTGGIKLAATVLPFILRGVALIGIDSVQNPIEERRALWERLASDLKPRRLDDAREIGLDELDATLTAILGGELQGRTVVKLA